MPQYILSSGFIATPNITFGNGYQAVSSQNLGSQTFSILHYPLDTHTLNTTVSKIKGSHELKFGYEARMHRISFLQVGYPDRPVQFCANRHIANPGERDRRRPTGFAADWFPAGRQRIRY